MKVRDKYSTEPFDTNETGEVILVDKPIGWTSFDVVKKMKSVLHAKKIGHAGTLDPRATGLLIVCTGPKTKSVDVFSSQEKEYAGTLELGVRTESYDSETTAIPGGDVSLVSEEMLRSKAKGFEGKQLQKPPMFSAAKYGGKPLYYYARRGRTVERLGKEIEVTEFEITGFIPPIADFRVVCSKGTYVRSLVHDLGVALGCGATMRSLKRTRIGAFKLDDALTVEDLIRLQGKAGRIEKVQNEYRASA